MPGICTLNVKNIFDQSDESSLPRMSVWMLTYVARVVMTEGKETSEENLGEEVRSQLELQSRKKLTFNTQVFVATHITTTVFSCDVAYHVFS